MHQPLDMATSSGPLLSIITWENAIIGHENWSGQPGSFHVVVRSRPLTQVEEVYPRADPYDPHVTC